jgi:hypothetical protein
VGHQLGQSDLVRLGLSEVAIAGFVSQELKGDPLSQGPGWEYQELTVSD